MGKILYIVLMLLFCNASSAFDDKLLVMATGSPSGVYYQVGNALCRAINKENIGVRCAVEPTPGSVYNLHGLKDLKYDLAIVQSDWEEHAYNGTGAFLNSGRVEKLRRILPLHNEAFTIITRNKSIIHGISDLKNKKINLGPIGAGSRATMHDIMRAKGWTEDDFKAFFAIPEDRQATSLCNGSIDAIILSTGHPNTLISSISKACDIKIVEIKDDVVDKFIAGNPEFQYTTIYKGMYLGVDSDIKTFGTNAVLVATSNLNPDLTFKIITIFEKNWDNIKKLHPALKTLNFNDLYKMQDISPYHDGAMRYLKDKVVAE